MILIKHFTRSIASILSISMLMACDKAPIQETFAVPDSEVTLSNEAIFSDWEYHAKRPGTVRWVDEGAAYTALETAPGFEDAVLEKDDYGDDIKLYEEIVSYDPATQERSVLITLDQLTPEGSEKALVVDDYQWSDDKSKLLINTNAEYVWRKKSRGDYWVLELDSGELWQLGGDKTSLSRMMFGKFSPDAKHFAWVWKDNIYVQDLASREVKALTSDASDTVLKVKIKGIYSATVSKLN